MKEDSPVNTQQNACTEQISSQTEWSASGMPCLRRSSNQSPSTSSNPDMMHSRLPQICSRRLTLRINLPLHITLINYFYLFENPEVHSSIERDQETHSDPASRTLNFILSQQLGKKLKRMQQQQKSFETKVDLGSATSNQD